MIYTISMSTVLVFRTLKFKINANDHNPPHVHIEGGGASVRVNLKTFEIMDTKTNFSERALGRIVTYVALHSEELMSVWEEYHGKD